MQKYNNFYLSAYNSKKSCTFSVQKDKDMATITLHYDAQNSIAAKTIGYVLSLGLFKTDEKQYSDSFNKSLDEARTGKTYRLKNIENPIAEILQ